jgi:hypothetical protein
VNKSLFEKSVIKRYRARGREEVCQAASGFGMVISRKLYEFMPIALVQND